MNIVTENPETILDMQVGNYADLEFDDGTIEDVEIHDVDITQFGFRLDAGSGPLVYVDINRLVTVTLA